MGLIMGLAFFGAWNAPYLTSEEIPTQSFSTTAPNSLPQSILPLFKKFRFGQGFGFIFLMMRGVMLQIALVSVIARQLAQAAPENF
jgi:hypothetical protein